MGTRARASHNNTLPFFCSLEAIPVASYSLTHPHSYQARVITRDSLNYYYIARNGTGLDFWKKPFASSSWVLASTITHSNTANQGDIASIAMDSNEKLHCVYYKLNGANYDLEYRTSTDRAGTWSSATVLQSTVTWGDATSSSAAIHIDTSNGVHVVFCDDVGSKPYYTYYNLTSWSTPNLVVDIASNQLRPTVITINTGRRFVAFSNASNQVAVYYSDNGTSWTDCSPSVSGATTVSNMKLTGYGNNVYVTGQEYSGTRRMILRSCDGTVLTWTGAWEDIYSGTGADGTLFIDSGGFLHLIFRQYNTGTFVVYHSSKVTGSWVNATVTGNVNHILPSAYWQEYHRFSPSVNNPIIIAPESAGNIYSWFLGALAYP